MLHVVTSHDSCCFSPFDFETMRLGPSASEVREHKLDALVKSLSHIQSVLEDPAMREVIGNLAPQLLDLNKNHEMAEAHAGKPASSNPGKRTMAPPAAPSTKSAKTTENKKEMNGPNDEDPAKTSPATKPDEDPAKTPDEDPAKTSPDEDPAKTSPATKPGPTDETSPGETEINSSTHRAAHARLVRRMEKLPVAEFPNMSRLWNGSRKETRYILNQVQYFWIISPRL